MFDNRTCGELLGNNFSNLSNNAVCNSSCAVNNFFNDGFNAVSAACAVTSLVSSFSLTTARSERDSHSGYEHKCNLFHFLFLLF